VVSSERLRATTRVFGQIVVLFAFVRDVVAKCTDVSEVGSGIVPSQWKLWFPRTALFSASRSLTCRIRGNNLGGGRRPKAAGVKLQWA